MGRRLVVGTAGHIDHGKTALVKALTGVDTDRWEEEKRRGITIDLGFAPLDLGPGVAASVVDVPGHEGFVRNMLAGATGIDVALLVIAADEGVMPQTEEHLAILDLLGVRRGIPVITKSDTVDAEWLGLVRDDVVARLTATNGRVRWDAPLATSVVTGAGLPELRAALAALAPELADRPESDLFRLPIDRVFALPGAGTVVTGTTWSGTVAVGDTVRLLPLGREARVRSIESHGNEEPRAVPGRRTALALVGVSKDELARGDVVVTGPVWHATATLDGEIELLPAAPRPLAHRARVRVHLGTAEVFARVIVGSPVAPGARAAARLLLEAPIVARGGDRFVLRSFSPVTTIGGGVVVDPFPTERRGRRAAAKADADERLRSWIADARLTGVERSSLPVRLGATPDAASELANGLGAGVVVAGTRLVTRAVVTAAVERLGALIAAHHAAHPLEPGMSLQAVRAAVAAGGEAPPEVVDAVCATGVQNGAFVVDGAFARLPEWAPRLDAAATELRRRLLERLTAARWEIPTVAELEQEHEGAPVRALLAHLLREGGVEGVDGERYAVPEALRAFREALEAALSTGGSASPAELRERFGLTRKYLIPLLEWADRRGITRRTGDTRTLTSLTARSGGP